MRSFVYCPPFTCSFGPGPTPVWTHCAFCLGYSPVRLILCSDWSSRAAGALVVASCVPWPPAARTSPHYRKLRAHRSVSIPVGPGRGRFSTSLGLLLEKGAQKPPSGHRCAPAAAVCPPPGGLRGRVLSPAQTGRVASLLRTAPVSPPDRAALTAPPAPLAAPRYTCASRRLCSPRHEADPRCSFFPVTRGT